MIPLAKCGKVKSYIGMDVNEGMLYHARKKAGVLRNDDTVTTDVTTLAGSLLEELPFGDNVFDVVVLNQVYARFCEIFFKFLRAVRNENLMKTKVFSAEWESSLVWSVVVADNGSLSKGNNKANIGHRVAYISLSRLTCLFHLHYHCTFRRRFCHTSWIWECLTSSSMCPSSSKSSTESSSQVVCLQSTLVLMTNFQLYGKFLIELYSQQ